MENENDENEIICEKIITKKISHRIMDIKIGF